MGELTGLYATLGIVVAGIFGVFVVMVKQSRKQKSNNNCDPLPSRQAGQIERLQERVATQELITSGLNLQLGSINTRLQNIETNLRILLERRQKGGD